MIEKVPEDLNMWEYHDFPKCPDWFSNYLVELQDKWGTHVVKAEKEETNDEGEVIERDVVFIRYVPELGEDYLEYANEAHTWTEIGDEFYTRVISEEYEFELIEGKTDPPIEEFGNSYADRLRRS